jgi:hypothetical protein
LADEKEAGMLFLFRGRYGVAARAGIGVVLLVVGLIIHHGSVLVVIGAALILWSAVEGVRVLRSRGSSAHSGDLR